MPARRGRKRRGGGKDGDERAKVGIKEMGDREKQTGWRQKHSGIKQSD